MTAVLGCLGGKGEEVRLTATPIPGGRDHPISPTPQGQGFERIVARRADLTTGSHPWPHTAKHQLPHAARSIRSESGEEWRERER